MEAYTTGIWKITSPILYKRQQFRKSKIVEVIGILLFNYKLNKAYKKLYYKYIIILINFFIIILLLQMHYKFERFMIIILPSIVT